MTYIIAEISGNHNGLLEEACKLIEAAAKCGCDAAKFQLYKPEDMPDANEGDNRAMYEKYQVPESWLETLFNVAGESDIMLFASVFAPWAVRALRPYTTVFKIASPESTRLRDYSPILHEIRKDLASKVIFSTGIADLNDVLARRAVWDEVLYCKAGYPAALSEHDLSYFRNPQIDGFSDHTAGIMAPLAAVACGASIIEKHFKLHDDCVDAAFSATPEQMRLLCQRT